VINLKFSSIQAIHREESDDDALRVLAKVEEAKAALNHVLKKGFNHWIVTFSGGKDSTTTVVISLEVALEHKREIQRLDIVYADTMLEIPVIHNYASSFLEHLHNQDRLQSLPLFLHVVTPRIEERFWVCLLGKGYPPPNQRFRWCTRRLKIEPVEEALKQFIHPSKTVIITGVRFGESTDRDQRLIRSCARGGECGHGLWFQYKSRLQAGYLAPIVNWQDCDVWDFLQLVAPSWGYSTKQLEVIYNGKSARFGCWMCSVVRQDKTMESLTSLPKWSHLFPLLEFRNKAIQISQGPASREIRPDGKPGRLKISVRKKLLKELLKLQDALGMQLITVEEIATIKALWNNPRYGSYLVE